MPLNWRLGPAEIKALLEDGAPSVVIHDEEFGHCRLTYDLREVPQGRYTFLMEISQDGEQWQPCMEGQYRRKG